MQSTNVQYNNLPQVLGLVLSFLYKEK